MDWWGWKLLAFISSCLNTSVMLNKSKFKYTLFKKIYKKIQKKRQHKNRLSHPTLHCSEYLKTIKLKKRVQTRSEVTNKHVLTPRQWTVIAEESNWSLNAFFFLQSIWAWMSANLMRSQHKNTQHKTAKPEPHDKQRISTLHARLAVLCYKLAKCS